MFHSCSTAHKAVVLLSRKIENLSLTTCLLSSYRCHNTGCVRVRDDRARWKAQYPSDNRARYIARYPSGDCTRCDFVPGAHETSNDALTNEGRLKKRGFFQRKLCTPGQWLMLRCESIKPDVVYLMALSFFRSKEE